CRVVFLVSRLLVSVRSVVALLRLPSFPTRRSSDLPGFTFFDLGTCFQASFSKSVVFCCRIVLLFQGCASVHSPFFMSVNTKFKPFDSNFSINVVSFSSYKLISVPCIPALVVLLTR